MKLRSRTLLSLLCIISACHPSVSAAAERDQFWTYLGAGGELAGVRALIDLNNLKHPDAQVALRVLPGSNVGLQQQIRLALMGGQPPVVYQDATGYALWREAKSGQIATLDRLWSEIDGDTIYPEALRRVMTFDGHHYAIPLAMSVVSNVFYNTSIFRRLDLLPPKNWVEFAEVCAALRKAGIDPLGNSAGPAWTLYNFYAPLVSIFGIQRYFGIARGQEAFDSSDMVKAFTLFGEMFGRNYIRSWPGANWPDAADELMHGTVGMVMMGDWASGYMKKRGFRPGVDYGIFPAPGLSGVTIFQADTVAGLRARSDAASIGFEETVGSVEGQIAMNVPKDSLSADMRVPPTAYDVITREEYAAMRAPGATLLPSLYILLPDGFKDDFGTALEMFAANPDPTRLPGILSGLEAERQKFRAIGAFVQW